MQHQSHTQKMLRNILRCIEANESIRQHPLRDTLAKLPASQNILWIFPATSFPTQFSRIFCYNSVYVCVIDAVPRVSFLPLVVGRIYHHLVLFFVSGSWLCFPQQKCHPESPPPPSQKMHFSHYPLYHVEDDGGMSLLCFGRHPVDVSLLLPPGCNLGQNFELFPAGQKVNPSSLGCPCEGRGWLLLAIM